VTSSSSVVSLRQPDTIDDPLTAILRSGARRLLAQAIEAETEAFLATMEDRLLPDGRDRLVRHGHGSERLVQTDIGPVGVRRVRLRDRGPEDDGGRIRFTSAILPRWSRRTRSLRPNQLAREMPNATQVADTARRAGISVAKPSFRARCRARLAPAEFRANPPIFGLR
jgi:hypothetical protein